MCEKHVTVTWCRESHRICLRELKNHYPYSKCKGKNNESSASRKVAAQTRTVGIGLTQNQGFAWLVVKPSQKTASAAGCLRAYAVVSCVHLPNKHIWICPSRRGQRVNRHVL